MSSSEAFDSDDLFELIPDDVRDKILAMSPVQITTLLYEHKCTQSSGLMRCCGEFRCETCHFSHLNECHPRVAKHFMRILPIETRTHNWEKENKPKKVKVKTPGMNLDNPEDFSAAQVKMLLDWVKSNYGDIV